jgi:dethiobiotin synthetase
VCVSLMSALRKRLGERNVGFVKPLGRRFVLDESGRPMDKDAWLMKDYFKLKEQNRDLSPSLLPVDVGALCEWRRRASLGHEWEAIETSAHRILSAHEVTVAEGTGHVGVGSIVGMSNADVAKRLGLPMVIVGTGGVGSTYDELMLNKHLCDSVGVPVAGYILNKILPDKLEMVKHYMEGASDKLGAPILGFVPYFEGFDRPSCADLESLFGRRMLSGRSESLLHRFEKYELVTTSLRRFMEKLNSEGGALNTCFITHGSRVDLVMGLLTHAQDHRGDENFKCGLLLSCEDNVPLPEYIQEYLRHANIPVMVSPSTSAQTAKMVGSFTATLNPEDPSSVERIVRRVEPHLDLDTILRSAVGGSQAVSTSRTSFTATQPTWSQATASAQ